MQTVKGSARKGFRNTHGKKGLPSGAKSPDTVPGGSANGGMGKGGENVRSLLALVGELYDQHGDHPELAAEMALLGQACEALVDASSYLASAAATDRGVVLLEAAPYLELFGTVMLGWLLLEQAVLAAPRLRELCAERGVVLRNRS